MTLPLLRLPYEIAEMLGVPAATISETIGRFNKHVLDKMG